MSCNYKDLERFAKNLEKVSNQQSLDRFYKDCASELALRLFRELRKRTPVGATQRTTVFDENKKAVRYKKGKKKGQIKKKVSHIGGELRRNWQIKDVTKNGGNYIVEIANPTPYASYVNYGHRQTPGRYVDAIGKRLKVSWVDGQFFLEISETEIERIMPAFLNKKLDTYIKECLNDD